MNNETMNKTKKQPRVVAFLADIESVLALIESSCGMTFEELCELSKDCEMLIRAYDLFVEQAAQQHGIDLSELGLMPGQSM